jgi:hypothetical protein
MLNTLIHDQALSMSPLRVSSSDTSFQRQYFPLLRDITLVGNVDSCTTILEQIAYPIATIANFECEVSSGENSGVYEFLQAAQSAVSSGGGDPIVQSFTVEAVKGRCILQCVVVHPSSITYDSVEDIPQLCVTLSPKRRFRASCGNDERTCP